jgi:hypothetical protein
MELPNHAYKSLNRGSDNGSSKFVLIILTTSWCLWDASTNVGLHGDMTICSELFSQIPLRLDLGGILIGLIEFSFKSLDLHESCGKCTIFVGIHTLLLSAFLP